MTDEDQRIGDTGYLVRINSMVNRAGLKRRELFLEGLGRVVADFSRQIGAEELTWKDLKERLGEEGWRTSIQFTGRMAEMLAENGDHAGATPWKLITISLCPANRATDASPDQMQWLDNLIEEAQRHCDRLKRTRQAS